MKRDWTFLAVATSRGNVIKDWLRLNPELTARVDAQLRRLKVFDALWVMPYFRHLGGGVGEIRFDHRNVEHRIYGYFGPGDRQFTMMFGVSGKQKQNKLITEAKKLRKQHAANTPRLETYDV